MAAKQLKKAKLAIRDKEYDGAVEICQVRAVTPSMPPLPLSEQHQLTDPLTMVSLENRASSKMIRPTTPRWSSLASGSPSSSSR